MFQSIYLVEYYIINIKRKKNYAIHTAIAKNVISNRYYWAISDTTNTMQICKICMCA